MRDSKDDDFDSIPEDIEKRAPHHGDGNQDGVADADQHDVASFPAAKRIGHPLPKPLAHFRSITST